MTIKRRAETLYTLVNTSLLISLITSLFGNCLPIKVIQIISDADMTKWNQLRVLNKNTLINIRVLNPQLCYMPWAKIPTASRTYVQGTITLDLGRIIGLNMADISSLKAAMRPSPYITNSALMPANLHLDRHATMSIWLRLTRQRTRKDCGLSLR